MTHKVTNDRPLFLPLDYAKAPPLSVSLRLFLSILPCVGTLPSLPSCQPFSPSSSPSLRLIHSRFFVDPSVMKKIVLKLDLNDDKDKQKAMKAVASLQGIDSIGMDMKERKMTVIGSVDPVSIVSKLRKLWHTNVVSIGPAKEEKKDEEPKEEPQKEEPKKEEGKEEAEEENKEEKEEETKKEENKEEAKEEKIEEPNKKEKKEPQVQMMQEFGNPYKTYYYNPYMTYNPYVNYYNNNNPYPASQYYYVQSAQENTNSCHIL